MRKRHTSVGKVARSNAGQLRIYRLTQGEGSVCTRRAYTLAVILTILVAVATALIAPSIDMPDTVLREHQVSLHAAGTHAANNLLNTGVSSPGEAIQSDAASHDAEVSPSSHIGRTQTPFVLRC